MLERCRKISGEVQQGDVQDLLLKIPKSLSSLGLVLSKGFNRAQLSHALPPSAGWSCAKHAFVSKTAPDVQVKYISEILSRTPP